MRVAAAIHDSRHLKIARFGDNMRNVAVTEGDKIEAQIQFGYQVNYHPVGDLVKVIDAIPASDIEALLAEYEETYTLTEAVQAGGELRASLYEAARQELGMKKFLTDGGFGAFTTTFEDLHGLHQLPGLACQRLMQQGFGFGAEGDWKTAALLRTLKVMGAGLAGGTSFMEDYTYHLEAGNNLVLGAHMLEVCPSIAADKPVLDAQHLGIGKKADPARLLFAAPPARQSMRASSISATASGWWSISSKWWTCQRPCRNCRWPAPCGSPCRTCRPAPRPGSWPGPPTIRCSPSRWISSNCAPSPTSWA